MKKCCHCKQIKPYTEFGKRSNQKDGYNYNCSVCKNQQGKESKYRARYGITLEDKLEMLRNQDGKCIICGEEMDRMVVDHCHKTGKVRGILCDNCNRGLG